MHVTDIITNQNKVSIVVPLYNQERYLDACLRSITNQTYKNLEIIVVNDGSTDGSQAIAEKWTEKDHRIKVINKANEGVTMARRDGYLKATGEFIAFVDSDDLLPRHALESMLAHIVKQDVDVVLGSAKRKLGILEWGTFNGSFPLHQVVSQPELFDKHYISFFGKASFHNNMWGRLYRKSVIDKAYQDTELFPTDIRFMGEDLFFNMKLFPYLRSMYHTDDLVYYYRYGGEVESFNPNYTSLFLLCDKRLALLDKYDYHDGYGPLYGEYVNIVYHYIRKLIAFKQAGKDIIIPFLENEFSSRELMPRLLNYFDKNKSPNKSVQLLVARDFEGMYQYAYDALQNRRSSLKFKTKRLFLKTLDHFARQ